MINKIKYSILLFFVFISLSVTKVIAGVLINEFSSESSSDWVELYANETTDISGWILDDDDTSTNMYVFPSGTILNQYSFISVNVGDRLNNSGDIISLYKVGVSTPVDSINYGNKGGVCSPSATESVGRYPDGGNTIDRFSSPTRDSSNTSIFNACPTPTPSPTATPNSCGGTCGSNSNCASTLVCHDERCRNPNCEDTTDCNCPTATPTATSTPTVSLAPTNTIVKKPLASKEEVQENTQNILGIRNELVTETPTPAAKVLGEKKNFPAFSIVLIGLGILFIIFSAAKLVSSIRKEYNIGNDKTNFPNSDTSSY